MESSKEKYSPLKVKTENLQRCLTFEGFEKWRAIHGSVGDLSCVLWWMSASVGGMGGMIAWVVCYCGWHERRACVGGVGGVLARVTCRHG